MKQSKTRQINVCGVEGELSPHFDGSINPKRIEALKNSTSAILMLSDKFWEDEGQTAEIDIILDRKLPTLIIFNINVLATDQVRLLNLFYQHHLIYEHALVNFQNKNWASLVPILMEHLFRRANL